MSLSVCSLASGSSGNCYLVKTDNTAILVDAGISGKQIWNRLLELNVEKSDVAAVLVTHEHSDHVKSLKVLAKAQPELCIYANELTWAEMGIVIPETQKKRFVTGEPFWIGDILIRPFSVSHDAVEPVGFTFCVGERQITIATDTGYINEELFSELLGADILILEANHDVDVLRIGKYPWFLKQRILGEYGHLSNEACGNTIVRLLQEKEKQRLVLLAHLSRENNFPQMAYQTVKNILEESNFYLDQHVYLRILDRDCASRLYILE